MQEALISSLSIFVSQNDIGFLLNSSRTYDLVPGTNNSYHLSFSTRAWSKSAYDSVESSLKLGDIFDIAYGRLPTNLGPVSLISHNTHSIRITDIPWGTVDSDLYETFGKMGRIETISRQSLLSSSIQHTEDGLGDGQEAKLDFVNATDVDGVIERNTKSKHTFRVLGCPVGVFRGE